MIHKLKTTNLRKPGFYSDGGNLYLSVVAGANGGVRRSWIFRYRIGKKSTDLGLGSLTIDTARASAVGCVIVLAARSPVATGPAKLVGYTKLAARADCSIAFPKKLIAVRTTAGSAFTREIDART
jgi:hypothetical protein